MKIAAAIEKMTDFYKGNIHDIYHFLKVWAFAKNIGEAEGLDPKTQETLEMAAVVHDIACPGKIRKYQRKASGRGKCAARCRIFQRCTGRRTGCRTHHMAGYASSYLYKCRGNGLPDPAGSRFSGQCRRERIFKTGD